MKVANLTGKMAAVAAVTLGAIIIATYYYTAAGGHLPFSGKDYTVGATVREPQGLQKHADVRSKGVKIGSVEEIKPFGSFAQIKMRLKKDITPLYRDATVLVRQKTLVGENYIDVTRGNPQAGAVPDGASLPLSQDQQAVPVDRILNTLDATTRAHISKTLQGAGAGFAGRGQDFNRLLAALRPAIGDGSRLTGILDAQRTQVADVVQQAGTVLQALEERSSDMHTLIRSAKATATAVAQRDGELRQAFGEFPSTLTQARTSVAKLSSFSGTATPVVANLRTGLVRLKPVFRDLKPTADQTKAVFDRLPALLKVADPMLSKLRTFSKVAGPAFPAIDAFLRQTTPALDYLKPYSKDIMGFLANFGLNHFYDRAGPIGYCTCPVSDRSFSNWTPAMRAAAGVLLDEGIVSKINHVENNPIRKPGQLPRGDIPFDGNYPHITAAPPGR
jgi:phospholipid/cholesterol/gamma-HCH transport system substrate-binding protein